MSADKEKIVGPEATPTPDGINHSLAMWRKNLAETPIKKNDADPLSMGPSSRKEGISVNAFFGQLGL